MRFRTLLIAATALAALPALVAAEAPRVPRYAPWGVALTDMDAGVKPGDDFFAYVNGAWDKRTRIAPDRSYAGVDVTLVDEAEGQVRAIAEE
ncbi:MAG TPA: M13 family peptidase, partial [Sphingomonas sp.]|nr:M13 family peptidase [Sphingomonas sp.]